MNTVKTTIHNDTAKRHIGKYSNTGFFHNYVLSRFFDTVLEEIKKISPQKTLEFGCGEGLFLLELKKRGYHFPDLVGIDLREDALQHAAKLHPEYTFLQQDLLDWDIKPSTFDLVIASQVLEHLVDVHVFLEKLIEFGNSYFLFTVPWEPFFRLSNLIRGRDIMRLGNHPEHCNLWNKKTFSSLISNYIDITSLYTVFPFIICVGKLS